MATTLPLRIDDLDLLAELHQLVLFPALLGVRSLTLSAYQKATVMSAQEQKEGALTYQQALEAGQLPLFA